MTVKAPRRAKPRRTVPVGMLTLLMLAFGGALALKAIDERQSDDEAILTQQVREAEALASLVRADLVSLRARMEGLLLTDASLEAIRRGVPFDVVSEREPPNGVWAQLADEGGVRIFAQDRDGRWVSGLQSTAALLPEALGGRIFDLHPVPAAPLGSRFEVEGFERTSHACASIADAGLCALDGNSRTSEWHVVVLPLPDSPTSPKVSPASTVKLTPSTALTTRLPPNPK
jgi:hypothetical protein